MFKVAATFKLATIVSDHEQISNNIVLVAENVQFDTFDMQEQVSGLLATSALAQHESVYTCHCLLPGSKLGINGIVFRS